MASCGYDFNAINERNERRCFGGYSKPAMRQFEARNATAAAQCTSLAVAGAPRTPPRLGKARCEPLGTAVRTTGVARATSKAAPLKLSVTPVNTGGVTVKMGTSVFKVLAVQSVDLALLGRIRRPVDARPQAFFEVVSRSVLVNLPRKFAATLGRPSVQVAAPAVSSYPLPGQLWCRAVKFVRASGLEEHGSQILLGPLKGIVCNAELLAVIKAHVTWRKVGKTYVFNLSRLRDPLQLKACGPSTAAEDARVQCFRTEKDGTKARHELSRVRRLAMHRDTRLRLCHMAAESRGKPALLQELQRAVETTAGAPTDVDERALLRLALGRSMCPRDLRPASQARHASAEAERPRLLVCNGQQGHCARWRDARNCGTPPFVPAPLNSLYSSLPSTVPPLPGKAVIDQSPRAQAVACSCWTARRLWRRPTKIAVVRTQKRVEF